jgi:hypothetical protein
MTLDGQKIVYLIRHRSTDSTYMENGRRVPISSQTVLARAMGLPPNEDGSTNDTMISQWKRRGVPKARVPKLCEVFNTSLEHWYSETFEEFMCRFKHTPWTTLIENAELKRQELENQGKRIRLRAANQKRLGDLQGAEARPKRRRADPSVLGLKPGQEFHIQIESPSNKAGALWARRKVWLLNYDPHHKLCDCYVPGAMSQTRYFAAKTFPLDSNIFDVTRHPVPTGKTDDGRFWIVCLILLRSDEDFDDKEIKEFSKFEEFFVPHFQKDLADQDTAVVFDGFAQWIERNRVARRVELLVQPYEVGP